MSRKIKKELSLILDSGGGRNGIIGSVVVERRHNNVIRGLSRETKTQPGHSEMGDAIKVEVYLNTS